MKKFLKKIRITHAVIGLLSFLAIFQFALFINLKGANHKVSTQATGETNIQPQCLNTIAREHGTGFIHRLQEAKADCESDALLPIKTDVANLIKRYKEDGSIVSASIYLENFKTNEWVDYNDDEKFSLGSLLKIPLMLTYLRMSETHPGLLDKELTFEMPNDFELHPVFISKTPMKLGKKYTVRQLLFYTIANSDNDAFAVLGDYLYKTSNAVLWDNTYSDLGLSIPDSNGLPYPMTAREYSIFLEVIFNGSYLNQKNSEYAAELLSQCDFKLGIKNSLPNAVPLIHKFGESSDGTLSEVHESGIIYINNSAYLITVMTKGNDILKLPGVISGISKVVYDDMVRMNPI